MSSRIEGVRNLAAATLVLAATAGCDGRPLFRDPGCTEVGIDQLHSNHIQITTKHNPNKIAVLGRVQKSIAGGNQGVIGFVTLEDPKGTSVLHAVINTTFGSPQEGDSYWVCGRPEVSQRKNSQSGQIEQSITLTDQELPPPNQSRADIRK